MFEKWCEEKRDPNEICIGMQENVREAIKRIGGLKKRINVVVLKKVTVPSTKKVDCTRCYC
jgi:hypothetical protein